MLTTIKLLLPALIPSWRFFSSIAPSPRVHYILLDDVMEPLNIWQELRPLQSKIGFFNSLYRLFWNPTWNETLYINSCAERLIDEYSQMREQEIGHRIINTIQNSVLRTNSRAHFFIFRISTVIRDNGAVVQPTVYLSTPILIKEY